MRRLWIAALAGLAFAAHAETPSEYPTRPIRFVLISAAGSGGDALGRLLADKMAPLIKGVFVMDNKPGASGAIATDFVAKAPADGYTIGIGGATTHVLLPASNPKLSYDSVKDFAPIGQVGTASILLIATNDFPANNAKELIALAKKSPGSVQYASWGIASTGHFCGELFNLRTQAQMSHIPYRSVVQIQTDMLGGHVKLAYVDMASGSPMVKSGKVKAITACTSRSPSLPDVSSYDDEGIDFAGKRMGALRWALYAPAATPKPIVGKLSAALKQVLEMPDVKTRLLDLGITAAFVGGDELRTMTAADIEGWKQIAKAANISNE
ncbi:tripartite tricarboxylate transporter substrate binding protein [Variovorax beijingensis]|uniref:Tripartite tricarboxylate transporter substrate binding protein n=1 Tax=Variovorax beijingensis TaxID=2496117 RepID=A0ABY0ACJ0_9BURK|nr:tripartite tricarboxylate transporter substrate binding protein [Variovorax beijingensis]RSZ44457.1 tripartite tricarboxylate transporter substrate binding protein [Variovorax beijingensis]